MIIEIHIKKKINNNQSRSMLTEQFISYISRNSNSLFLYAVCTGVIQKVNESFQTKLSGTENPVESFIIIVRTFNGAVFSDLYGIIAKLSLFL